jgi:hypothetical protein
LAIAAEAIRAGRSFDCTGIDLIDQHGKLLTQVYTAEAIPRGALNRYWNSRYLLVRDRTKIRLAM